MRRKSERNKSKSSEKKVDTTARKSRRTSRRRKRSTSHSSSEGSDDVPLVKAVVVETPQTEISPPSDEPKKSTSNSDEEKQEQPIWKVKTSESPSGEIQKLKICLQRPSTTPERTEKSPRRRRAKASSQSDDAYLTPDEKPQQQHQSRRKLRRGSPPPSEPLNKDVAVMKVIKDDNDEASEGKGKLECSQRRQDTENEKCVQDSEVNKSLGPSELSNNVPQEEDIISTTSKDEPDIIKIDNTTPDRKDNEIDISPAIKKQDSAIEPIEALNSEHLEKAQVCDISENQHSKQSTLIVSSPKRDSKIDKVEISPKKESKNDEVKSSPKGVSKKDQVESPLKTESKEDHVESSPKGDSKKVQFESSPITESKKDQIVSSPKRDCKDQLESSPKTEVKIDEVASSPKGDSKKDELKSSPITESKKDEVVSSPKGDSKKDQLESSPKESKKDEIVSSQIEPKKDKLESSPDSKDCKVESLPRKDAKDIEASPTKSKPLVTSPQCKLETSEQTTSVASTPKLSESEKLTEQSSPTKDLQTSISESHIPKKRKESEGSLVESSTKTDEIEVETKASEVTKAVSQDSLKELEISDEVGIDKKDKCKVSDIENAPAKIDNVEKEDENNKTSKQDIIEENKDSDKLDTIVIEESVKIGTENMIVNSEMINKEDFEKISETIKRDLNRMNTINDDSDKSEPEEKIIISEDEEIKVEISTTPTPETQQIIRPLHRRKWGKYSAKLQPDIRLTLEALTVIYPGMKLVAEEDLKLEIEEHREVIRPVRKEREIVVLPPVSPKEEDVEKEVSNIGLNRKISIVNDEASKLQPPPSPPKHPVSSILYLTNLVRPFTLKQLKELLSRTGKILDDGFWTDRIKSRCYVQYETEDEAEATRNALHGVQWPIGNGKKLMIDFGLPEAMEAARTAVETPVPAVKTVPEKVVEKVPELDKKEQHQINEDERWDRKRAAAPTREWDLGKVPQDHRDRSRSRDRARSRSDRSSDKRRHPRPESPSNGDHLNPRKKKKEEQTEVKLMDDLFRKTKAPPSIYWLPLTPDQIAKKQQQRLQRMAEHKRRMEESTRRVPSRDFGRGAPRSRRRYNAD